MFTIEDTVKVTIRMTINNEIAYDIIMDSDMVNEFKAYAKDVLNEFGFPETYVTFEEQ